MKKVLVVEDEIALRRELAETFPWEAESCTLVGAVGSMIEARERLDSDHLDILITDIKLPDGSGLELLSNDNVSAAIVITGFHEVTFAQRALREGAADFLLKPLDDEELTVAVRRAVARCEELEPPADSRVFGAESEFRNPIVSAAFEFIENHYGDDVSLFEASAHLGISEGHLAGVFKSETGTTFVQALTAHRMRVAVSLLTDYRNNITEISQRCGYRDPAYFARVFRRHHGMSPRSYRRNHPGRQ